MKKIFAQIHEGKIDFGRFVCHVYTGILDRRGEEIVAGMREISFTQKEMKTIFAFPSLAKKLKKEIKEERKKVFTALRRGCRITNCGGDYTVDKPK